ncbi:hypothetical protein PsorP6_016797 [Peronosclerospora sorghi]|uniref:Uncharacterized protein n=1 Tax=Peronosclerospora sorghi TaxID=230839 RepID=A0ACC0WEI2_9STRA|nr:hypothetical protein PsorP6_016797 [Peronosclerospora sorghi]
MELQVELTGATTNAERVEWKIDMFVADINRPALTYDGFIVPETRSRMKNHDYTLYADDMWTNMTFLVQVAVDKSTRVACAKADEVIENFYTCPQIDPYTLKERCLSGKKRLIWLDSALTIKTKRPISYELDTVTQRYDSQRIAETRTWKQKLSKLGINFQQNLFEEATEVKFSLDELKGMSDNFIRALEKDTDGILLSPTLRSSRILSTVESTRKDVEYAFKRRCTSTNVAILEEMLEIRHKVAVTLGYENHAAYSLSEGTHKCFYLLFSRIWSFNDITR